jgi:hypothetical protein
MAPVSLAPAFVIADNAHAAAAAAAFNLRHLNPMPIALQIAGTAAIGGVGASDVVIEQFRSSPLFGCVLFNMYVAVNSSAMYVAVNSGAMYVAVNSSAVIIVPGRIFIIERTLSLSPTLPNHPCALLSLFHLLAAAPFFMPPAEVAA